MRFRTYTLKRMWRCPSCGASDAWGVRTVSVSESARYFVRPWAEPERYSQLEDCIRRLWGSEEARLISCGSCGLRSADPFVAGSPEFFSLVYAKQSQHPYPSWRWEYQFTRAVVQSTAGSVLDIGAGDGGFQRQLIDAGVDPSRLYASEYNAEARQVLNNLGVTATGVDLRELPPADHAVVCGHQVIQHLSDLDGVFRAFRSLTAESGLIALSVSNGDHKARQEAAGGLIDMPPNHISTWRYSAFVSAASRRGWKVIDYKEQTLSRIASAKALAVSKTHRARQSPKSLTAFLDRHSPSPHIRFRLMALSAAVRFPPSYIMNSENAFGGSIWVLMGRI